MELLRITTIIIGSSALLYTILQLARVHHMQMHVCTCMYMSKENYMSAHRHKPF